MLREVPTIAYLIVADVTMLAVGIPLQRYTWWAVGHARGDTTLLWMLLAANLALGALFIFAMTVAGSAGMRFFRSLKARWSRTSGQPTPK